MPPRLFLCAALALCLLSTALPGCARMPRMLGGSGDVTLMLDGEQAHETSLPKGRTLTLDLRDPAQSGYVFAGTVFDPALLRLEGITPLAGGRVRYQFTATGAGETDIQIKIRKNEPGYRPDVFKRVRVSIE
ncbi:MAG: hypothetical protein Q7U56_13000 [Humidesulfovibrio sp.]|nr:hypothetical protein [Desulfovibrio sp.]MDO9084187.1 hypothetical protein [Humidesulfovibrio sp.]